MCLIHISEAPSLTEDNLLRLQMEQFEHMRRQMEEKQKKQLEEMLQRQQQVLRLKKKNLSQSCCVHLFFDARLIRPNSSF